MKNSRNISKHLKREHLFSRDSNEWEFHIYLGTLKNPLFNLSYSQIWNEFFYVHRFQFSSFSDREKINWNAKIIEF